MAKEVFIIRKLDSVPCEYEDLNYYSPGYYKVRRDGKWGVNTWNSEMIEPCQYDRIWP